MMFVWVGILIQGVEHIIAANWELAAVSKLHIRFFVAVLCISVLQFAEYMMPTVNRFSKGLGIKFTL